MPELKSGLLWRMDARKPSEAVAEIIAARDRFVERMGKRPTLAYLGQGATFLLERAGDQHLMPVAKDDELQMLMQKDGNLPVWDILITGDEPKEPQP